MGAEAKAKLMRKQLREMIRNEMDALVKEELVKAVREELSGEMRLNLRLLEKKVTETLEKVDERSKDTLGFLMRNVAAGGQLGVNPPSVAAANEQPEAPKGE